MHSHVRIWKFSKLNLWFNCHGMARGRWTEVSGTAFQPSHSVDLFLENNAPLPKARQQKLKWNVHTATWSPFITGTIHYGQSMTFGGLPQSLVQPCPNQEMKVFPRLKCVSVWPQTNFPILAGESFLLRPRPTRVVQEHFRTTSRLGLRFNQLSTTTLWL